MGKLFKHIFKRDFVDILKFILIPPVLVAIFAKLSKAYAGGIFGKFLSISVTLMMMGIILAIYTIISNDYQRFYGRNAAFYSNLPIKAKDITGARLLNSFLIVLIMLVILFIEYLGLNVAFEGASWKDIGRFLKEFNTFFGSLPLKDRFILILAPLVFILATVMIIQTSATIGSEAKYKKFGSGIPFVIFLVMEIVINYIIGKLTTDKQMVLIELSNAGTIENKAQLYQALSSISQFMVMPILVGLIVAVLLYMRCLYSHNNKLSVK